MTQNYEVVTEDFANDVDYGVVDNRRVKKIKGIMQLDWQ